ncbi:MAG: ABC transporter permease subunit [Thermoprotei archaeon]
MADVQQRLRFWVHRIVLGILAIIALFPVYVLLINGLKSEYAALFTPVILPAQLSFTPLVSVGTALALPMVNSLIIVLSVATISTYVGGMFAYYVYVYSSKLTTFVFSLIAVATFIPFEIVLVPLTHLIVALGLMDTYQGIILAMLFFYVPTAALLLSIFFAMLPKSILESAKIDGANDWLLYNNIVLPLSLPGIISTFIFVIIESWNNFFLPLVLVTTPGMSTASLSLMAYTGGFGTLYNDSFAAAFLASLLPILVFLFLGKYFLMGFKVLGSGSKG